VRALIVGGGRRGLDLAEELIGEGHAARVVTRGEERVPAIRAIGAEPWPGDPDRIGTLRYALDNVTLLLWLLGTATGDPERVAALHGSRLEMMLERTVDTTVRGVLYEGRTGAAVVQAAHDRHGIPIAFLEADPSDEGAWVAAARSQIDGLLATAR